MALSTSVPRRMPPSTSSGSCPARASATRGSTAALAGAVSSVRPPWLETMTPASSRLAGVVRLHHALEQHRQLQPGDVVPGRCMGQQAVEQGVLAGPQGRWRRGGPAGQVDGLDAGRQAKAGAALPVARAVDRGVDGEHQGLVAGLLGALDQLARDAPVGLQVELEPQRAAPGVAAHGLGHVLEPGAGLGAEHQTRAQCGGRVGGGQFAVGMRHALVGHGCQQDGVGQRAAEQRHTGVAAGQRAQHARQQLDPVPGAAVGAQRQSVGRAAAEVSPGVVVQHLAGMGLVVGQRDQAGRQGEGGGGAHVSAHMPSRLWQAPVSAVVSALSRVVHAGQQLVLRRRAVNLVLKSLCSIKGSRSWILLFVPRRSTVEAPKLLR